MPRTVLYELANERSPGTEVTKTEKHIIGEHESGWVFTKEVPLQEGPSTVSIPGFTEVTDGSPAAGEFDVAYDVATPESRGGAIKFNAADDGTEVTITYKGRGSIVSAGMVNDLQRIVGPWNINLPKAVADTPDDDFAAATLDAKWTVTDGGAGTVSLLGGSSTGIYELFPDHSLMAVQVDNANHVLMRQSYTLPDGKSIVARLGLAWQGQNPTGGANNELQAGISLDSSDTDPEAGTFLELILDTSASIQPRILGWDGAALLDNADRALMGASVYLRITRSGTGYVPMYSLDGWTWVVGNSKTIATAPTRLWLFFQSDADPGDPLPITVVHWVRLGGIGLFPW
jgi:hypothetical protein